MSSALKPVVLKFGGTSVQNVAAFERVISVVRRRRESLPVVVVSAPAGVTNALLEAVSIAETVSPSAALDCVDPQLERYAAAARHFLGSPVRRALATWFERVRTELAGLLRTSAAYPATRLALRDEIVSFGERLSAQLAASVFSEAGIDADLVDARRCVRTDEQFTRAVPLADETREATRTLLLPLLERGVVPVLGGFIGSSLNGATTTLGRGGSDYSAALIGAALDAREVQIWTDVDGILTADPRLAANARLIERISYAEAGDLALHGAKVLHPKTIEPVVAARIPLRICNTFVPESRGTLVGHESEIAARSVGAVTHRSDIVRVLIKPRAGHGAAAFSVILETLSRRGVVIEHCSASRGGVELVVEGSTALEAALREFEPLGDVSVERDCALVCPVGNFSEGDGESDRLIEAALDEFDAEALRPHPSSRSRLFVVAERHVAEAVRRLHGMFVESGCRVSASAR